MRFQIERMRAEDNVHTFSEARFGLHLNCHPQAVAIYMSESPPRYLPLNGMYFGGGVGVVYGHANRISDNRRINVKIPSFSLEAGYD